MSLKSLTTRLQRRADDAPGAPANTPIEQFGLFGEAVNDPDCPARSGLPEPEPAPGMDAGREPAPKPPADPNAWRVLSAAYLAHHFTCPVCIAASRGSRYGLRCGAGAALWTSYQNP